MASSSPSVISVPEALSVNTRAGGRVSRAERRMLMRRLIASVALAATLVGVTAPPAHAGKSTDIALGLASFAVFNQVVSPFLNHRADAAYPRRAGVYRTAVTQPAAIYETPFVVYAPPSPPAPYPTVVQYPHGRYEPRWEGQQYVWVWIPAPPPPPPAP